MLEQLKFELEDIAFMLARDLNKKEIHSKVIKCLVLVEEMSSNMTTEVSDVDEINKVSRRLRMWSKPERQNQYNAQILNAFLELFMSGYTHVTEQELSKKLGNPEWFTSNFIQMKAKADKNHGKVFDTSSGYIKIWEPIRSAVDEYRKKVFRTGI
ncbi:hypothetical protein [Vibrio navarrensis]|uniref:Uncharacterized protein n=1 Tax=Vibrio navarrensis TaxID=29495 RepID=A0AAJ4I8V8_9VIBR|nr:hypothetical protein [Vibrio navarrensis]QPL52292.1 hypothetical protein I3X05_09425 [Vibrio navarrensis]